MNSPTWRRCISSPALARARASAQRVAQEVRRLEHHPAAWPRSPIDSPACAGPAPLEPDDHLGQQADGLVRVAVDATGGAVLSRTTNRVSSSMRRCSTCSSLTKRRSVRAATAPMSVSG